MAADKGSAKTRGGSRQRSKHTDAKPREGAQGKPPVQVAVEQSDKYREMYAEWLNNRSPALIAEKHGLQVRRVNQITADFAAADVAVLGKPSVPAVAIRHMNQALLQANMSIEQCGEILLKAIEKDELSVAIGAIKQMAERRQEVLALKVARGLVPRNMGVLEWADDADSLMAGILSVFDRFGVSEEAQDAIAELVNMAVERREGEPPMLVEQTEEVDGVFVQ